jgi:membrane-bound serine protease (ClpP class)
MEFLLDPNVAYVLIVTCLLLGLIAIVVPGTGVPEVALTFCLVLAAYKVYKDGINLWAVTVLALSIVPFLFAIRTKTRWRLALLGLTILLMIGGSLFLFTSANGWPAVNPLLAVVVSLVSGGLVWVGADRAVAAMQQSPANDPDALIGQTGEARTDVHAEGSVQAGGELWSARSEKPIKAGSSVRVLRREGFVLIVEKESQS